MWLTEIIVLAVFVGAAIANDEEVNVEEDYLGCYADDKTPYIAYHNNIIDRALPYQIKNFFGSKKRCVDACAAKFFPYAALQAGYLCFCGTDFSKYGPLDDAFCNIKCRGDRVTFNHLGRTTHGEFWLDCGGKWANSVYSTYGLSQQEHKLAKAHIDDAWIWKNRK